jgi:guanylate kinase
MAPLIVVSGPSGVGKTTVVDRLLDVARLPMRRAVTATTRPQRGDEADGINYHFWTREKFEAARDAGEMLEWAIVYGRDYYGTPRSEVDPHREAGRGVVLVIDVQGAATVRAACPDCLTVFVKAPSFEALEARLRGRASESEERILKRLETAREELTRTGEFQHVIVNDEVDRAANELAGIIRDRFIPRSA